MAEKEKTFKIVGNDISDGYHTFQELYEHRNLLFINLCLGDSVNCWWKQDYEGHFCLYWDSPLGQISYHMGNELLPLIKDIINMDDSDKWDGHTSATSILRLFEVAKNK